MALTGNRNRREVVTVTITKVEKNRLKKAAIDMGMPVTALLRQQISNLIKPKKKV